MSGENDINSVPNLVTPNTERAVQDIIKNSYQQSEPVVVEVAETTTETAATEATKQVVEVTTTGPPSCKHTSADSDTNRCATR